jgi:hypothetical protein
MARSQNKNAGETLSAILTATSRRPRTHSSSSTRRSATCTASARPKSRNALAKNRSYIRRRLMNEPDGPMPGQQTGET